MSKKSIIIKIQRQVRESVNIYTVLCRKKILSKLDTTRGCPQFRSVLIER